MTKTPADSGDALRLLLEWNHELNAQSESINCATQLARHLGLRVDVLLIEDLALMQAADLPFTSEITVWGAEERTFSMQRLKRDMSAISRKLQGQFEKIARREQIAWQFSVIESDKLHWIEQQRLGSRILIVNQPCVYQSVALSGLSHFPATEKHTALQLVYTGDDASDHALDVALLLVNQGGSSKSIQVMVVGAAAAARLENKKQAWAGRFSRPGSLTIHLLEKSPDETAWQYLMSNLPPASMTRILILPFSIMDEDVASDVSRNHGHSVKENTHTGLSVLLNRLRYPLILVR